MQEKSGARRRPNIGLGISVLVVLLIASSTPVQAGPVEDATRLTFDVADVVLDCANDPDCGGIDRGLFCSVDPNCNDDLRLLIEVLGEFATEQVDHLGEEVDRLGEEVDNYEETVNDVRDDVADRVDDASQDEDRDFLPDEAEAQICGRAAVRDAINERGRGDLGVCWSSTNYELPRIPGAPSLGPVLSLVYGSIGDGDRDLIPDNVEPTLCSVEDQNTDLDGSCSGNDYSL